MKELYLLKCEQCNDMVRVLKSGESCFLECCEQEMKKITPNSVEASIEKHIPSYEIQGDYIIVKVNHVMEEEHYIEWISMVSEDKEYIQYLNPGDLPEVKFKYTKDAKIYAYCNKHELWKTDVK